jgi:7-carboxy-7-deazaguanine synthase
MKAWSDARNWRQFANHNVDKRVMIIMDLKCPSSKLWKKIFRKYWLHKNFDEVKFVIGSREDYEWTNEILTNTV